MRSPAEQAEIDPLAALDVDRRKGLTTEEAERRRARYGPNILAPDRREPLLARLLRPLRDPMALLLLGAGLIYLVLGDYRNAGVMFLALIPIAFIDFALEARAERALAGLRRLVAARLEALRDGKRVLVPSEDLVPGDVVYMKEGDVVPADGILIDASDVQVDESSLTGESLPVSKEAGLRRFPSPSRLLAGTTLMSGRGTIVVTMTGSRTAYGQIAVLVGTAVSRPTPTQAAIARLIRQLGVVAGVVCTGVVVLALLRSSSWAEALLTGVSLAIAAIPEEFPVVFTLYLTLGAWRMASKKALIRRLVGVETLGSVSIVCADKTGTLTLGKMKLTALYAGGKAQATEGITPGAETSRLLESAVLACEPSPYDPLEQAIVAFAPQAGVKVSQLHSQWRLVHEYPFEPRRKYMSHVWRSNTGTLKICAKGAIEGIVEICVMSAEEREAVLNANRQMAAEGMRVIAVAENELPRLHRERDKDENQLRLVGLVGFVDPPRSGVREAIAECLDAEIRVVMITGDHPLTAHNVAESIGLPHRDRYILTGDGMEAMTDEELQSHISRVDIFARITPVQKHRLVRLLKAEGAVVAMTGDGINDAPALKAADVGIAMGRRGTEVAREAATMVLLDDNFRTIVEAVREGRRIYQNLRHAFSYLVAFHAPIISLAFFVPLLGAPLVLVPAILVWLELILHPTASLVFEADQAAPELMRRPPRNPKEHFLAADTALRLIIQGLVIFVAVLAVYLSSLAQGLAVETARSVAVSTLVIAQTLLVLTERSPDKPFWQAGLRGNKALPFVLATTLASLPVILYVPFLATAMQLSPISLGNWSLAVAVAVASTMWVEAAKLR
ncbi:MAG: cation-transporting P-type ATPase [Chloroflexi bacterium]|nr:cation-transporting P-type ATPase [Chloroflexota bacterium]